MDQQENKGEGEGDFPFRCLVMRTLVSSSTLLVTCDLLVGVEGLGESLMGPSNDLEEKVRDEAEEEERRSSWRFRRIWAILLSSPVWEGEVLMLSPFLWDDCC